MVSDILQFILTAAVVVLCYVLWQVWELHRFRCSNYEVTADKLKMKHRIVVLSDVHLWSYGKDNERLISAVRSAQPELILFPGDLIVYTKPERFLRAEVLMKQLIAIAPVYFSNGNHESRLEQPGYAGYEAYQRLKKHMLRMGVHILNNEEKTVLLGSDPVRIHGLELPLHYYKKGVDTPLELSQLSELLRASDQTVYEILLAHTPKYVPEYFAWGADLCLSGHYHGGLVCLPFVGSIISPQFQLLPKYSFGKYEQGTQTALISRGLGTHTFHVRIFNRAELLVVTLQPAVGHTAWKNL